MRNLFSEGSFIRLPGLAKEMLQGKPLAAKQQQKHLRTCTRLGVGEEDDLLNQHRVVLC